MNPHYYPRKRKFLKVTKTNFLTFAIKLKEFSFNKENRFYSIIKKYKNSSERNFVIFIHNLNDEKKCNFLCVAGLLHIFQILIVRKLSFLQNIDCQKSFLRASCQKQWIAGFLLNVYSNFGSYIKW